MPKKTLEINEHTITEMITGLDIVHAQIKVAQGLDIHSEEVGIPVQEQALKKNVWVYYETVN